MRILLTNDDGIQAEGIHSLYRELVRIAEVTVVAPDTQRSSVGHGITLSHPIWPSRYPLTSKVYGIGISGTPADCVKFGISVVLKKKKPDLVISGINLGTNDGCSVFYSGTVAGAREGALCGIPSMAVSLDTFTNPCYKYAARVARKLAIKLKDCPLAKGTFLSVNVPSRPESQIRGIRVTRQGVVPIQGSFVKRRDPNLRDYYWMTGRLPASKDDLRYDTYALANDYVTVTPITCDATDYDTLDLLKDWNS